MRFWPWAMKVAVKGPLSVFLLLLLTRGALAQSASQAPVPSKVSRQSASTTPTTPPPQAPTQNPPGTSTGSSPEAPTPTAPATFTQNALTATAAPAPVDPPPSVLPAATSPAPEPRSEERRVGKECGARHGREE